MANKNTLVDPIIVANLNQSPQLTKSPQMQNGNIQKINDDNRPSPEHKIYHFHNCRIMNSFNTRTITMENSGNKVPQVTICSSFFLFSHLCPHVMSYYQFTRLVAMKRVSEDTTVHLPLLPPPPTVPDTSLHTNDYESDLWVRPMSLTYVSDLRGWPTCPTYVSGLRG